MRTILLSCAACAVWLVISPGARSQVLPDPGSYLKQEPPPGQLSFGAIAYVDDGTCPSGEILQITGGNFTRGINRKKQCVKLPDSALTAAQEEPKFLSKQEVETALVGKVLWLNDVRWEIHSDGHIFVTNRARRYAGGNAGSVTGVWELKEDGAMCMTWRDNAPYSCNYYFLVGDKLKRTFQGVRSGAGAVTITFEK